MNELPLWILAVSTCLIAVALVPLALIAIRLLFALRHLAQSSRSSLHDFKQKFASWGLFVKNLLPFQKREKHPPEENSSHFLSILEGILVGMALWKTLKKRR